MALTVGIKHLRDGVEPQSVILGDRSVIGIIGTAGAADAEAFPLNRAVALRTNDAALRLLLGSSGTVPDAVAGISAQLEGSAEAAQLVVVLVDEGATPAETIANIVGSEASKTGIWAFLDATEDLGLQIGLIVAPGFTSQAVRGLVDPVITAPGDGGANGTFPLIFTGGTGSGAAGTFTVTGGALTAIAITNPGSYTVKPTLTLTNSAGLTGATASVDLEQLANPIMAAIPTVLDRLEAGFIPEGPTSSRQAWLDWLETLPASRWIFHPLRQDAKTTDAEGDLVTKPLSPYVAALYARRDSERNGVPSGSIMNQSIYGLVGVTPSIRLSLTDETSEGQMDLAVSGGIVARGDVGDVSAPGSTGFTFWGSDTLAAETEWLFAHVVRLRSYIEAGNVAAQKKYLGKQNITLQSVEAVLNTLRLWLTKLHFDGHILSPFLVGFDPDQNLPEELRLGEIDISFAAEEPPVLRRILIRSRRHRAALEALAQAISVRLGAIQSTF
ncbi:hypothetical protein [Devosia riboflavina]|uniref:hypothetical protein n=1 Tax=Devosia riboflavina TaxID=46914 RepID=UPI00068D4E12|nr:hypothetical protein [Devosia riboflavina]